MFRRMLISGSRSECFTRSRGLRYYDDATFRRGQWRRSIVSLGVLFVLAEPVFDPCKRFSVEALVPSRRCRVVVADELADVGLFR